MAELEQLNRGSKRELVQEDDEDIYSKKSRESLLEDDELTPLEEAFMQGWDEE